VGAAFAAGSARPAQPQQANGGATCTKPLPRIIVHANGHFLCAEDGSPFFWLGDTAWQLIQEPTRHECSYYLQARARQGFTVIQAVVLAEFGGVLRPTTTGLLPFAGQDPRRPNEAFFDRVNDIVAEAGRLGLYMALLPTWGDKLTAPWGVGPRLFRNDNLDEARAYTSYLADKLKAHTNVIWILGGDRPPRTEAEGGKPAQDWTPIWRALAQGLAEGCGYKPTIVYHPSGGESSSRWLHEEPWLSVNGMQSGHGGGHDVPVWEMVSHDYNLSPPKPTLDLEPNYEDHPYNPWPRWDPATGYFRDHDVRKQVYRSVFAGACGVTYGHHAVWQFANDRHPVENHADRNWVDALYRPAGRQMQFVRLLLESRPFFSRIPDQELIAGDPGHGGLHLQATRDADGSWAFIYFPMMDQSAAIDLSRLSGDTLRAWWYDPRTGIASPVDRKLAHHPTEFVSPPYGPDWVLAIEDVARNYAPPGLARPA
jgi:hypothetical protein